MTASLICAIPPTDQTAARIGRGYGPGPSRTGAIQDQLHGGMDFVATPGSPILTPLVGTVVLISADSGPGFVRGMNGYGNCVVLQHNENIPGLPNPFWTLYAHMSSVSPRLQVGQRVSAGTFLGNVGNTTNGQFRGMGAHLHVEVRNRAYPMSSYERNTLDPAILFNALGMQWDGSVAQGRLGRRGNGQLVLTAGGPSDPSVCSVRPIGLAGLEPIPGQPGLFRRGLGCACSARPTSYGDLSGAADSKSPYAASPAPSTGGKVNTSSGSPAGSKVNPQAIKGVYDASGYPTGSAPDVAEIPDYGMIQAAIPAIYKNVEAKVSGGSVDIVSSAGVQKVPVQATFVQPPSQWGGGAVGFDWRNQVETPYIPGVPNSALYVGGALLALYLLSER